MKHAMDELRSAARVDPLTGLYNRRHLADELRAVASASTRQRQPFAVVMIDLDHFKAINDSYGHETGDEVLRATAQRLVGSARKEDIVGRWGGDEFLAVLPASELNAGRTASERLLEGVRSSPVRTPTGAVRVTASAGLAAGVGGDPQRLLLAADSALYEAEGKGRKRVAAGT